MNITAKSRYALKIMMDLADHQGQGCQQRHRIAKRQGIPVDFMDHILARLRGAHLVESIRGRSGGFQLKQEPTAVTVWDIFIAVEDVFYPVRCLGDAHTCTENEFCISHDVWAEVYKTIHEALSVKTLARIVHDWQMRKPDCYPSSFEPSQCRGPSACSQQIKVADSLLPPSI